MDATYEIQGAADLPPGTHECHVTAIERRVNKNGAPSLHITLTVERKPNGDTSQVDLKYVKEET